MEWTYTMAAASCPRVLMRVAQVFDQQMVPMRECRLVDAGDVLRILVIVDVEEELARRMHAKLYKQIDLQAIELEAGRSGGASRNVQLEVRTHEDELAD